MKVKDLMQHHVVTLRADDSLDIAEDIVTLGRLRHLPVVEGEDRVVGIVTQRELLKASLSSVLGFEAKKNRDWLGKIHVRDVMTAPVTSIGPTNEVTEALERMLARKFGCLPVVEDGRLVGLLTETDCLRLLQNLLGPKQ